MTRIEREKITVAQMVDMYCKKHHQHTTCDDCRNLIAYAHARLEHCRFGNSKTSCRKCPVHCYKPDMREKMRTVMRYSGPRLMLHHPVAAIRHLINK